ncbi:MAG: LON peptidase substrate-binding domain-containing protein, partial [Clostridia bacterium]|nr:LON peptidase substrate-binding domain-containing protein [Clostridia bacterium]
MSQYTQRDAALTLPVLPLGGIIAFPTLPLNLELTDDASIAAADAANENDAFVFLVSLQAPASDPLNVDMFYKTGTVAKIKQSIKSAQGEMRVVLEGYARAELLDLYRADGHYSAVVDV